MTLLELVLEDRLGVVQQPADQRRLAVVDGSGGGDPQELRGAAPDGVSVGGGGRGHNGGLEVALTFAVFHGGLGDAIICPGLATFGDASRGDLRHDVAQACWRVERTAPVQVMSPTVR